MPNPKKKILFVITKSNWGGAQRYVYDLATNLPKETFDVAVALGGTGSAGADAGKLKEKLEEVGVRTIFVKAFMRDVSAQRDLALVPELVQLFRSEKPDVVHLNSSKAGAVGALAARLAGIKKIVFTSHGLVYDENRNTFWRAGMWFATWVTFLLCHQIILISQDTYKRAQRLPWCTFKVHLIHNGLPPLSFLDREKARAELGLPFEGVVIGALGELTGNKNYQTLIRSLGILKDKGKLFIMCIVGGGEEKELLEKLIAARDLGGYVRLVGFKADGYRYLQAFDIFTLPSLKEGLPYVLLEAGQAGLPTVASRIAGTIDIVEDGVSGLLVEPKDETALAKTLITLLDSPIERERFSQALQKKVTNEFSIDKMIASIAALYLRAS